MRAAALLRRVPSVTVVPDPPAVPTGTVPPTIGVPLAAFYEATQIAGPPSDGAAVSSWLDLSGNSRTATLRGGDTAPAFSASNINGGGKQSVYFAPAAQKRLDTTLVVADGPFAVVVVVQLFGTGTAVGGSVNGTFALTGVKSGGNNTWRTDFGGVAAAVTSASATSNYQVVGASLSAPSGGLHTAKVSMNGTEVSATGVSGSAASGTLVLGGLGAVDSRYNGTIAASAVYRGEPTSSDRHIVEAWLGTRYGVTVA